MGFFWAVLHPLLMTLILTFVFTLFFGSRTGGAGQTMNHYPPAVYILCGLLPWQFFASAINAATRSLVDYRDLIKKVHFPREVVPVSSTLDWTFNFLIGLVLLLIIHLVFGGTIGIGLLWFAALFVVELMFVLGLALILSCLNVFFRDVQYIVEVAVVFGFYATPVFYPLEFVEGFLADSPWLLRLYMLNPMAGLVPAYRQAFLDNQFPDIAFWGWPVVIAAASLVIGVIMFRRKEPIFADYL